MWLCVSLALADTATPVDGEPPVADAGVGLMAEVGDTVALNGLASADPEGAELLYSWTQSGGPPVDLKKASTAEPEFAIEAPGTLRFTLVVNDGTQDSDPDTVEIVAPEHRFGGSAEGACATADAPGWLAAAALAGLVRRRR